MLVSLVKSCVVVLLCLLYDGSSMHLGVMCLLSVFVWWFFWVVCWSNFASISIILYICLDRASRYYLCMSRASCRIADREPWVSRPWGGTRFVGGRARGRRRRGHSRVPQSRPQHFRAREASEHISPDLLKFNFISVYVWCIKYRSRLKT